VYPTTLVGFALGEIDHGQSARQKESDLLTGDSRRRNGGWSRDRARQSWAAFRDTVFRSATFCFVSRRPEEYGLSDRQSTNASDRAVDSCVVLVRMNDRLQDFRRRTC
jgi:hypothetical protein